MTLKIQQQKPPYLMIFILFIGTFIALLNNSLINLALPTIMTDLNITNYSTVQWLATAYMLVSGVLIPVSAFLITKFTDRQLFIAAMSIFALGTIFSAFAHSFGLLLTGRIIQAVGGSIMSPLLMNVMLVSFPIEKRGTAMGFFGLSLIVAPALGPTISGYIVEHYEWRYLFVLMLPIVFLSLVLAIWKLKNVLPTKESRLDYFSLVLSTIGFGGVLYGCSTAGSKGWSDPWVYSCIIVGIIAIVAFVVRQLRLKNPMLDLYVFRYPMYSLGFVISAVIATALFSSMILMPTYIQTVRGVSPLSAGLMMLPAVLVMGLMSPITGRLFDRFGPRALALTGLTITSIGTYFMSQLQIDSSYAYIISIHTFRMFGMSMVMMPIMTNGLNQLPKELNPHGTALNNMSQQVSGSIGTAILVTIMNAHTTTRAKELATHLQDTPTSAEQMTQMKEQLTQAALLDGINLSFLIACGITLFALVLSFFLKRGGAVDKEKADLHIAKEPLAE